MARVFITGSSDGLGLLAGRLLAGQGHQVTLHARNDARAADARRALPQAEAVVTGDVSGIAEMRRVAAQVNALGRYDAVIHNVGVGYRERHVETADGLSRVFAINVLAPYLLTALIEPPRRLVYLSSGMHRGGDVRPDRPAMDGTPLERIAGLLGQQVARYRAGVRGRPPVATGAQQRGGTRVGADQDGRPRRAGRHGAGPGDAGLAGGQRRRGSHGEWAVFPPSEAACRPSRLPAGRACRRNCWITARAS